MKAIAAIALSAITLAAAAQADPQKDGGKEYELVKGGSFSNAGAMIQHLRDREDAFSGNPKEIVDHYGEWSNVGDLIHDKRVEK